MTVDVVDDDAHLVPRLRAGDEAAFTGLVRSLHDTLRQLARTIVRSDALVDEVVQDTWIAVLHGLDRFEGRSSLRTWVARILVNRARTTATRDRRSTPFSALGTDTDGDGDGDDDGDRFAADGSWARPPAPWGDEDPAGLAMRRELIELVGAALEHLPERQRVVMMLRDVKGWSPEEVCAALDLTEANQRVLLHRARARVRGILETHLAPGGSP